jgi:hypothetical protein
MNGQVSLLLTQRSVQVARKKIIRNRRVGEGCLLVAVSGRRAEHHFERRAFGEERPHGREHLVNLDARKPAVAGN